MTNFVEFICSLLFSPPCKLSTFNDYYDTLSSDAKSWGLKENTKYYIGVSNILLGCSFASSSSDPVRSCCQEAARSRPGALGLIHEAAQLAPTVQNSGDKACAHSPGSCMGLHWSGEKPSEP